MIAVLSPGDAVEVNFGEKPFLFNAKEARFNADLRSMRDAADSLVGAHQQVVTRTPPNLAGVKVPAAALAALQEVNQAQGRMLAFGFTLSQIMFPASNAAVQELIHLLQSIQTRSDSWFVQLCRSGQLEVSCEASERKMGVVQEGFEQLAAGLGMLCSELHDAEKKVHMSIDAALSAARGKTLQRRETNSDISGLAGHAAALAMVASVGIFGLLLYKPVKSWVKGQVSGATYDRVARAEQQQAATSMLAQYCQETSQQLSASIGLMVASAHITRLAEFSSKLRADVGRIKATAGRAAATEQDRAFQVYRKQLVRRAAEVLKVCHAYSAALETISSSSSSNYSNIPGGVVWEQFKSTMRDQLSKTHALQALAGRRWRLEGDNLLAWQSL